MINRVVLLILDSVGCGALPDAEKFGDVGVNTLSNIALNSKAFNIPNLISMGIGNIEGVEGIEKCDSPNSAYGRMGEASFGKDTTTGHWELAGLYIDTPFQTYPDGFPKEIIDEFEAKTGRKVICNKPASGTEILEQLGEEHVKTGDVIVYTSADSVFQIAAHEEVVPLDELYSMCQIARDMLMGEHQVARVIARPFIGEVGKFERTPNRRDYSLSPFNETVLDFMKEDGYDVQAVGKIVDIFNEQGITEDVHTISNMDGVDKTIDYIKSDSKGLIFTNLVDFDAKFGHRRNVSGYREAIEEFDVRLPEILDALKEDDLFIITADHGNDPTYKGTDHTREYVPLLVYGDMVAEGKPLGTLSTFSDVAATISEIFNVKRTEYGKSFLKEIIK